MTDAVAVAVPVVNEPAERQASVAARDFTATFHAFELPRPGAVSPGLFVRREEMPRALLAAESTTYGWDTVNCIKLKIVNEVLSKSSAYPKNLKTTLNEAENWTIDTSFSAWTIAPGGSGGILMMKLPIPSSTMTYGGDAADRLSFSDGWALISLKLRYVPQVPGRLLSTPGVTSLEKLIADAHARTPDDPPVVVQRVNYGNANPSPQEKALYEASFALLLNSNLDKFSHVFAVVNLNQKTAGTFAWLKPSYTSYAYFQGVDEDNSYFAVLNQTENRSPEGLTNQVAASAIPAGMNASILVSQTLFIRQFVFPGLSRAFTRAEADSFEITGLGQAIAGKKRVQLDPIRVGAIDYTPYMDSFRMQIAGDEVQINSKISINISPGIEAYIESTYFYVLGLVKKPDGSMTLDFEESRPPIVNSWYTVEFWVTMTQLIASIIGAVIATAVGEAITKTVTKVIVVSLITIVAGIAAAIPSMIAEVVKNGCADALPPIGPMVQAATDPVSWPASSGFELKTAELNGSLQLGGMLNMSTAG